MALDITLDSIIVTIGALSVVFIVLADIKRIHLMNTFIRHRYTPPPIRRDLTISKYIHIVNAVSVIILAGIMLFLKYSSSINYFFYGVLLTNAASWAGILAIGNDFIDKAGYVKGLHEKVDWKDTDTGNECLNIINNLPVHDITYALRAIIRYKVAILNQTSVLGPLEILWGYFGKSRSDMLITAFHPMKPKRRVNS